MATGTPKGFNSNAVGSDVECCYYFNDADLREAAGEKKEPAGKPHGATGSSCGGMVRSVNFAVEVLQRKRLEALQA